MSITNITTDIPGQVGDEKRTRLMRIICTDDLATITTAGYLNVDDLEGYNVVTYDYFHIFYGSDSTTFGLFAAFVDDSGVVTLVEAPLPSNTVSISGSSVVGNFPIFNSTSGQLVDSGAKLLTGVTSSWTGGGTSHAFTVNGLGSFSCGSAVIVTSTNAVSIVKAVPTTNTLTITFSADPGTGTTVSYFYTTAALS